ATRGRGGSARGAPATVASVVTALAGWFLPAASLPIAIAALALGALLACWICGRAEERLGHDAHPIVLDEVIGQSIALLAAPKLWWVYLAAGGPFLLFCLLEPPRGRRAPAPPGGERGAGADRVARPS